MKNHTSQRKDIWVLGLFVAANLLAHLAVVFSRKGVLLNWYLTDDVFYYFKTALNIVEGRGISYDGIAPTNGFHPLWMLVCVPLFYLARFNLYLPLRALVVVAAVINGVSGFLLYRLFNRHASQAIGWLASTFWMFLPAIHELTTKLGLETGINALALIFLVDRVSRLGEVSAKDQPRCSRELVVVGLAATLALLSRLDNIFLLVMLGMWLILRDSEMRWHTQLDWLVIFVSAVSAYFLRMQNSENQFRFLPFEYLLLGFSMALKPLFLYVLGMYRSDEEQTLTQILLRTALAVSAASLLMALVFYAMHDILGWLAGYPRMALLYDWALSLIALLGVRMVRKIRDQRHGHCPEDLSFRHNFRLWFGRAAAYFLPLFITLMVYMVINRAYAGSAMPVSGQIKRWWGMLPNTIYGQPIRTLTDALGSLLSTHSDAGPFWLLTHPLHQAGVWLTDLFSMPAAGRGGAHPLILALIWGVVIAFVLVTLETNGRQFARWMDRLALMPILVGCLIHALSYKATGYLHVRYWYWIAQMLFTLLFFAILTSISLERLETTAKKRTFLENAGRGFLLRFG